MKKLLLGAVSCLLILGCKKDYDGQLDVNLSTTLKAKSGTIVIQPGVYKSTLSIKKSSALVQVDLGANSGKENFEFKFPSNMQLPSGGGEFDLSSAQTGQPYDMHGVLRQFVEQSELKRGREGCSYQRTEYECYYDQHGHRICGYVSRTYQGWRDVEYYDVTTTDALRASLQSAGGPATAVFSGTDSRVERRYVQVGPCW
jgi:hypothetical protein